MSYIDLSKCYTNQWLVVRPRDLSNLDTLKAWGYSIPEQSEGATEA